MAKNRFINTRFWNDSYVSELEPLEKLLFIYFITNEHTNICGIYELPKKIISVETGVKIDNLENIINKLSTKVYYIDGWVYIKNFAKHQRSNDSVNLGIERALKEIPEEIMSKVREIEKNNTDCIQTGTSVGTDCQQPILKPILKPEPYIQAEPVEDSQLEKQPRKDQDIFDVINAFKEVNPSYEILFSRNPQREAVKRLLKIHGKETLINAVVALPQIISIEFCPSKATTPLELERDWGKIKAFMAQKQSVANKITII